MASYTLRGPRRIAVLLGLVIGVGLFTGEVGAPSIARADEAPEAASLAPLLSKLAKHADQFESMKKRGSFTMSGRMEELDSNGKVDATKEMVVKSTATPAERLTEIVRYTENGADKTDEARKKAEKRRAEHRKDKATKKTDEIHLPFLASEQPRYHFTLAERDAAKNQVRVVFTPLVAAENAFKGSAWVDEGVGEILTLAFSPSKYPMFVDHVDVTMRFDLTTPLGRAPSSFTFDARGGFLIVKKHYRGSATISDAKIGF